MILVHVYLTTTETKETSIDDGSRETCLCSQLWVIGIAGEFCQDLNLGIKCHAENNLERVFCLNVHVYTINHPTYKKDDAAKGQHAAACSISRAYKCLHFIDRMRKCEKEMCFLQQETLLNRPVPDELKQESLQLSAHDVTSIP